MYMRARRIPRAFERKCQGRLLGRVVGIVSMVLLLFVRVATPVAMTARRQTYLSDGRETPLTAPNPSCSSLFPKSRGGFVVLVVASMGTAD